MHKFWFAGHCCREYGIYVSGENTFNGPARGYELVSIPGRSGDLIRDNKRYKNITVSYPAFIHRDFLRNTDAARAWLLGSPMQYHKLEDDYHPDEYRMAIFTGPLDFDTRFLNRSGETTLNFNCKPHRYIKAGTWVQALENGQILLNNWDESLPLIQITGNGSGMLTVGGVTVTIDSMDSGLTLDAETQNAYNGLENKNGTIRIAGGEFPILPAGETRITWSGGVTAVEITPRWRAL